MDTFTKLAECPFMYRVFQFCSPFFCGEQKQNEVVHVAK